ncbi:Cytochrome P450 monooxygenase bsc2 [Fulvia fulva]|uniref:Cytochrome P450 monooxygenase bsc2 n=1 Tax=Passalora fulva TaxID=5499 RepID=A0A9Q8P6J5_PASFU|nr:Cytochrome P450 monooxygenase bsc2 [Fulvia fulva]KAK4628957.1 Cytochrome P450 monooxygenase bsc2 [Fulvia fulva]KAK4630730.1 Cytochrome P450 monooxygenase bsc2 [Fulvia fulva]UJO14897.1 Cytochrome P450 monooxygenase bsc2 [Fulvia fulva]WPV12538.1 Cytochrome P450 monooxygenase bsc2 [Fulvia fulva]WPV27799.1 Cytochrome P450 monooxygenase bsc2 [Fulvia fulva]
MTDCKRMLDKGKEMTQNGLFQVSAGSGYKIIVPSRFADELRNNETLSFSEVTRKGFYGDPPGFDSMKEASRADNLTVDMVRTKLTQALGLVTDDIVDEATYAIDKWFGESLDWRTHRIKPTLCDVVARVSTRILAGKGLARDEEYLEIAKQNTIDTFTAAQLLHGYPGLVRPLVHWFIPQCQNLRRQAAKARSLLTPILQQRSVDGQELKRTGKVTDAFTWMEQTATGRPVNHVEGQLNMSLAAIHTATATSLLVLDVI